MTTFAMLCAVAGLQVQKIDFEVRATTVANALGKLSRISGQVYKPEDKLASEIICARAKQVSADEFADKLAEAMQCEWRTTDQGKILFRSEEKTRELEESRIQAQMKYLDKLFEPKRRELEKIGTPYDQALKLTKAIKDLEDRIAEKPKGMSLDGPRLAAPSSTLTTQLMLGIPLRTLASLPEGRMTVFANEPNRAQLPLGKEAGAQINNFELAESQAAGLLPQKRPEGIAAGLLDDIYASVTNPDGVGKVLFTARRQGRFMTFNTSIYSGKGKLRSWGFTSTYQLGDDSFSAERQAGAQVRPAWVKLSPGSVAFLEIANLEPDVSQFEHEVKDKQEGPSDAGMKILLHPDEIDPLSLATTDGCNALADREGKPYVAYLSDSSERAGRLAAEDGKLNLSRFEALLKNSGHRISTKDGWLTIANTSPLFCQIYRLPRAPLGRFLRLAAQAGAIDLEPLCRFHYEAGFPAMSSSLERLYRKSLTDAGVMPLGGQESHSHDSFAALGALTPNQWQELRRGGAIRLGQTPARIRKFEDDWLLQGTLWLRANPSEPIPDLYQQATEFAPGGMPAGAMLRLKLSDIAALNPINQMKLLDGRTIVGYSGDGRGYSLQQTAKGYATGGYYKSWNECLDSMRRGRFQIFRRTDYEFILDALPTHRFTETFSGAAKDVAIKSFDDWPANFRREFEEIFKREFKGGGD
ncbi:MAG: hypothetical protein BGO01_16590 [Armatimonadetes bacterium 55-13]|nr:hypothetical protein [Armatimonadota bacterium]OJU65475.1 MAG: hypothetical protein BGO01_16590 [Armatimonadetes bacterium 55-13]